jgi:hypothetical protein
MKAHLVGIDGDGHFFVQDMVDRPKLLKAIQSIQDGDALANADDLSEQDIMILPEDKLITRLNEEYIIQRGQSEIVYL